MSGRDKYAARLAKARKKIELEKARRSVSVKPALTDSHKQLHKHSRNENTGNFEKFIWRRNDVLYANDANGTKFTLRKPLYKCAFHQEILSYIDGSEKNGKPKKAVLKVINVVPEKIYPDSRKVDEEEIVTLIAGSGDSPCLAQCLCIFMHECFHVLAFEPYHFDLATFFGDDAIEVRYLRFIMQQVLDGLRCLERLGIVHGDLRGSNIKLTTKDQVRVQIAGFQFAQFKSDIVQGTIMQTSGLRAPEVIVGAEITEAIDMWSAACTFAYHNTMEDAFQGQTPLHVLWSVVEQQGMLPDWMLESGLYTKLYFEQKLIKWRLKKLNDQVYIAEHTPDAAQENYGEAHELDESMFWELIGQMLDVNPKKRITPAKALEHPFITMAYLKTGNVAIKDSKYARMCAELADPTLPLSNYYLRKAAEDLPGEAFTPPRTSADASRREDLSDHHN